MQEDIFELEANQADDALWKHKLKLLTAAKPYYGGDSSKLIEYAQYIQDKTELTHG